MTLQWQEWKDGKPGPWKDHNGTEMVIPLSSMNGASHIKVRVKPVFEPGYYQQTHSRGLPLENSFVQWWSYEPDPACWTPVDVAPRG
jgi:hypothetical protein